MATSTRNCFSRQAFIPASQRVKVKQLEQAELHKSARRASDFAADRLPVLEALEEAGAVGLTTRELTDRGGGMRRPDRIHDLRKSSVAIRTVSEGPGIHRYILCKFLPEEEAKPAAWDKLRDKPVTNLELWDVVRQ